MKINKPVAFFILLLFLPAMFLAAEKVAADQKVSEAKNEASKDGVKDQAKVNKEDELAKVSILPFEDRTGSKNFQYMSESLSDAVSASMMKDFSYNRTDPQAVKKSMYDMEQLIIKEKIEQKNKPASKTKTLIKNKKDNKKETTSSDDSGNKQTEAEKIKTPEQLQREEDQLALVKKVAKNLELDIVIYGNYSYDNETNELVFTAALYLALSDAVKELDETRNVVDNTIFRATEKVAKNLVTEIHIMIEEAEKIAAEKGGEKIEDKKESEKKKPGEKTALTRKVAMTPTFDWGSKKFSLTLSPGFLMFTSNLGNCGACQLQLSLAGRYWVVPHVYLGLLVNAGGVDTTGVPFFKGMPMWLTFDAMAMAGYGLPLGRWLISADIDAGYFLIIDKTRNARYYNPAFGARVNTEYLVSEIFSVGLSVMGHMYYDKPKPLIFGGLALTTNIVF